MLKIVVLTLSIILFSLQSSFSQQINLFDDWEETDEMKEHDILFQLVLYDEVNDYLDDLFQRFSEGYIEPDAALDKIMVLKHAYAKKAEPVPPEAERLYDLVKHLFSRIENYFIHYKRSYREHPLINLKLAQAKFKAAQEADMLHIKYQ